MEQMYQSEKTKIKILAKEKFKDDDLTELADSGLLDNDIFSYSKDSFVFETANIIMPKFIYPKLCSFKNVLGVQMPKASLSFDLRKKIHSVFMDKISNPEKIEEINNILKIKELVQKLQGNNKDSVAEIIEKFFLKRITDSFNVTTSVYSSDGADELFFKINVEPKLLTEELLEDYFQAILYESSLYKTKVGSDKCCFCPIETKLGGQVISLLNSLNDKMIIINDIILRNFVETLEIICEKPIEDYLLETNKYNGIEVDLNTVYYYKNVATPLGTCGILTDSEQEEIIYLAYLQDEIKFLPLIININDYNDGTFSKVHTLNKICNLI